MSFPSIESLDRTIAEVRSLREADIMEEAAGKMIRARAESLEAYIKAYLAETGARIEDLMMCEEHDPSCYGKIITRYWLEARR